MKFILIIGLTLFLMAVPAHAKIYKWKDENGKVNFTNDPTKVPKSKNKEVGTIRGLPPQIANKSFSGSKGSTKGSEKELEDLIKEVDKEAILKKALSTQKVKKSYQNLLRAIKKARANK